MKFVVTRRAKARLAMYPAGEVIGTGDGTAPRSGDENSLGETEGPTACKLLEKSSQARDVLAQAPCIVLALCSVEMTGTSEGRLYDPFEPKVRFRGSFLTFWTKAEISVPSKSCAS